jgi:hypothetical protein
MNRSERDDLGMQRAHAMLDEADLHALFAARRPDAAAFARGVAERLQRGGGAHGTRLPRAAAWLPFDAAALGAGKLSWLMVPVLGLAGVLAMFAFVGRSLRASAARAAQSVQRTRSAYSYVAESLLLYLVAAAISGTAAWFGVRLLMDLLLVVMLATMVCFAICVRVAARAGVASRRHVAGLAIQVLGFVATFALMWHFDLPLVGDAQWSWLGLPIVLLGIGALLPLARRLDAVGAVVVAVPLAIWLAATEARPLTRQPAAGALTEAIATTVVQAGTVDEWLLLPHLVEAARGRGETVSIPPAVRAAVDAAVADETPVEAMTLHCAARLGIYDDDDWRRIAAVPRHHHALRRLLERGTPLRPYPWQEHELAMLRATGGLDAARDRITQRLLAGCFGADDLQPLRTAAVAVRWLQLLGRDDAIADLRPRLHGLIAPLQRFAAIGASGGFASTPAHASPSSEATRDAVFLIRQVGAHAAIDLPALRRHLVREGSVLAGSERNVRVHRLAAFADRVLLERDLGTPRRSPWRVLVEERNVVALAAIVLLCVGAAWWWPRPRGPAGAAMP